jgi:hypothetical protein
MCGICVLETTTILPFAPPRNRCDFQCGSAGRSGVVPALDFDQPRLLDRLCKVALFVSGVREDIVFEALVQLRRAVLHGLLRVENEGVFLIFDLDRTHGLRARNLVLGDDRGDLVPVITDVAVQKKPIGDVLMMRVGRPRMARGRKREIRDVETRKHLDDAGNRFRLGRIDLCDHAVGDGGMTDF